MILVLPTTTLKGGSFPVTPVTLRLSLSAKRSVVPFDTQSLLDRTSVVVGY